MKHLRWIASVFIITCIIGAVTGCFGPNFHTAQVDPGTKLFLGGGYTNYEHVYHPEGRRDVLEGGWAELSARYAWNERYALLGRVGALAGYGYSDDWFPREGEYFRIVPRAGIGLQGEFFKDDKYNNNPLSWIIEVGYPQFVSVSALAGIKIKGREMVTLGLKYPLEFSVTVHPTKWLHVSAGVFRWGVDWLELSGGIHAGVGLTFAEFGRKD